MKSTPALCIALIVLIAVPGEAAEHYIYTTISVCDTWPCQAPEAAPAWHSGAWVDSFLLGIPWTVFMKNDHSVYRDNAQLVGWRKYEGYTNAWHSYLLGGPQVGHCYNAHLTSKAGSSERDVPSSPYVVCWYGPDPDPCVADPWRIGCDGNPPPDCPLIVNLDGGDWPLSGRDAGVLFDIDGDGEREAITWTAAGSELAFVVKDINGNGVVDGGRELFGTAFLLPDGSAASNGFVALSSLDVNHDGMVNADDPAFAHLSLWVDRNHNAVTDPGELQPIRESDILGLGTEYRRVGRTDVHGNKFRLMGHSVTQTGRQPYYDVIFVGIE